jgi:hypothetical protein
MEAALRRYAEAAREMFDTCGRAKRLPITVRVLAYLDGRGKGELVEGLPEAP